MRIHIAIGQGMTFWWNSTVSGQSSGGTAYKLILLIDSQVVIDELYLQFFSLIFYFLFLVKLL